MLYAGMQSCSVGFGFQGKIHPLLCWQGWRLAYWVVAGVGALACAMAWVAIVEPRSLLRKSAPPPGGPPPRRAWLAVARAETLRVLRDFWTVLKIPTFVVMMAEVWACAGSKIICDVWLAVFVVAQHDSVSAYRMPRSVVQLALVGWPVEFWSNDVLS